MIYDSVHGNTERIARAVAHGLGPAGSVGLVRVGDATPSTLTGLRTLVVGCPTHRFRPTPATSAWLAGLADDALAGVGVAAFDTRFAIADMPSSVLVFFVRLFGTRAYSATHVARRLVRTGGHPIAPAEGFFVRGMEGPLRDGEPGRASTWGRALASRSVGVTAPGPRAATAGTVR